MNKHFKRLSILTLMIIATLGMAISVSAGTIGDNGKYESTTGDNEINIPKAIELASSDGGTVKAPHITYTYTLSNGTEQTIGEYTYKAGDVAYLATSSAPVVTVVFDDNDTCASGGTVVENITYTFDPTKFPSAGVYRYNLRETGTSVAPSDIGIIRDDDYNLNKFLDVYVTNSDSGNIITGYGLVIDDGHGTGGKSTGWNHDPDLEAYKTYSIVVTKNITGSLADKTAVFPFEISFSGKMTSSNMEINTTDSTGSSIVMGAITEDTTSTDDTREVTGNLGNTQTIVISGVPTTVTFNVAEKNPTGDVYKATAASSSINAGATLANEKELTKNSTTYEDVVTGASKTNITGNAEITVTNTLESPSPTGVILYYAPYILIGIMAVLLLVISTKTRRRVKEQN